MAERARELGHRGQRHRLAEVRVLGGVEREAQRRVVREAGARKPEDLAHAVGDERLVASASSRRAWRRGPRARRRTRRRTAPRRAGRPGAPPSSAPPACPRARDRLLEDLLELRIEAEHLLDHPGDDEAGLRRGVELRRQPPVAEEGDRRDGVVEVREGRDRQDVARDLLRLLLHVLLPPRILLPRREDAVVLARRRRNQELDEPLVRGVLPLDGGAVEAAPRARRGPAPRWCRASPRRSAARPAPSCRTGASGGTTRGTAARRSTARTGSARAGASCGGRRRRSSARCGRAARGSARRRPR